MLSSKLVYRRIVYLFFILSLLFLTLIGSVMAQMNTSRPFNSNAGEVNPPPPDDLMETLSVDSTFLTSRSPLSADQMTVVGGTWTEQGPRPAFNGQVENVPNWEVVGAVHALAAHPVSATVLYAGSVNGGIWRTDNATSPSPIWMPLTDDKVSLSISALEFDPTDSTHNTLLAGIGRYSSFGRDGGARAGLLHTIDGGATWIDIMGGGVTLVGKNISGVAPRGSTFVASVNTADSFTCGNIGLFRSTDTGGTFVKVGPPGAAYDLAGDPMNNAVLYSGLTYVSLCTGGVLSNGVYQSTDTGATWTKVSSAAMDALIVDGVTDNIEIAAHGGNVFVNIIQNGQSAGIFYSNNGGASWMAMDLPLLPAGSSGTISSVTPGSPIGVTTGAAHGLSTGDEVEITNVGGTTGANGIHTITVTGASTFTLDGTNDATPYTGGGNWQKLVGMNPKEKPGSQGAIHASIRVNPIMPTTVYVGGDRQDWPFPNYIGALNYTGSLFRGDATIPPGGTAPSPQWDHLTHSNSVGAIPNGGTANSSAPHADSREMVVDAGGDLIESDDGGVYRRTSPQNNAGDWFSLNGDLQISEMHSVAYDSLSNVLISGNQDTGTTYQPTANTLVWNSLSTADGGDVAVDNIVLAGSSQSVRYSSFQNLGGFRRSVWNADGSLSSVSFPGLMVTGGGAALVVQFYTPIATNEVAGNRLLIGAANSLYESLDGGNTITEIGPGLTVESSSRGGDTIAYGGMQGGTPNPDVFYAATGGSVAVRTTPGGSITTYVVPGASTIRGVAMDPMNWQVAFAIDDNQVFQTTNAGAAWTDVTGSMPDTNLRSIAVAPGAVFVGGGTGVYVMDMGTGNWDQFGSGLPNVQVRDLDYDDSDHVLAAGTLGRGAWLLSTNMAAISVTKMVNTTSAAVGETITYTYAITNTGNDTLSPVTAVDDKLGSVTLGTTTLSPGASTSGTLTYTVVSGDLPGPITNTVTATGTASGSVQVTAQASESVTVSWPFSIYLPLIVKEP
jgi:hypothetical protein